MSVTPARLLLVRFTLVGTLALSVTILAACGPDLGPPAQAVQDLLELRSDRSEDASAYAEYVASVDLAQELAAAAVEESTSATPPTPGWDTPYVASETSATARVVVVWDPDDRFEGWPVATIFLTESVDGRWLTMDAEAIEDEADVPEAPVE